MGNILITNNPLVKQSYLNCCSVVFVNGLMLDVLISVRDYVHKGHKLLSHPLSGSVKPNENPYKSILISKSQHNLDLDSLKIIENSIQAAKKFLPKQQKITNQILTDFQTVDYTLITSAFCNI